MKGARAGAPVAVPIFAIAVAFGVLARSIGWGIAAPTAMSALVFSGSAQFAAASVLAAGGEAGTAVVAAVLVNARYLPMGVAVAASLRGRRLRRALEGQAVVGAGWAVAHRGGGRFDREVLIGFGVVMYLVWVFGTVIGAAAGERLGDLDALGLDAVFPAFFLALLAEELRSGTGRRGLQAAALAAGLALLLVPLTPPGVPVVAACAAALLGLRRKPGHGP